MDIVTHDEYAAVFSWKGESLEEYWECILNELIQREDDGKGHRPELIVDDGADMNLPINEGKKAEDLFLRQLFSFILYVIVSTGNNLFDLMGGSY